MWVRRCALTRLLLGGYLLLKGLRCGLAGWLFLIGWLVVSHWLAGSRRLVSCFALVGYYFSLDGWLFLHVTFSLDDCLHLIRSTIVSHWLVVCFSLAGRWFLIGC